MFVGGIALYILVRVAQPPGDPAVEPISKPLIYVPFLGKARRATPGDLYTTRGIARDLHDPTFSGRKASIEEMAPVCPFLSGSDGTYSRRLYPRSGAPGRSSGGT